MASLASLKRSESEETLLQAAQKAENKAGNVQKFPISRLRPSIQKFQTVLDIDLDRLLKHMHNIDKLTAAEDWVGLHKEQVNASRTVQQVQANLRELERARAQVYDDDIGQFDSQVQEVRIKSVAAVENFLKKSQVKDLTPDLPQVETKETSSKLAVADGFPVLHTNLQLHVVPENTPAAASWEELQESMEELNELVHQFADNVKKQGEAVDRIEDNIETAHVNVRAGTISLGSAAKYKAAIFPVAGALIGGVVAGPVGLIAGAKIGLAGALGGVAAGFAGGSVLKARHNKSVAMEMTNMEEREKANHTLQRSTSVSEVPDRSSADGQGTQGSMLSRLVFGEHGKSKSLSED